MGKRSNFKRMKNDAYDTPYRAALPLLAYLPEGSVFAEPCAGKGDLIDHLEKYGHRCSFASDISPRDPYRIMPLDAVKAREPLIGNADFFISNPPWTWALLLPIIEHCRKIRPTWLLLDANLKHNLRASGIMRYCSMVVSVGRVKWVPGSKFQSKDSAAWYRFEAHECETIFKARAKR